MRINVRCLCGCVLHTHFTLLFLVTWESSHISSFMSYESLWWHRTGFKELLRLWKTRLTLTCAKALKKPHFKSEPAKATLLSTCWYNILTTVAIKPLHTAQNRLWSDMCVINALYLPISVSHRHVLVTEVGSETLMMNNTSITLSRRTLNHFLTH